MPKKKAAKKVTKTDEFLEKTSSMVPQNPNASYQEARGRRGKEVELWKQWDAGGRQEKDLEPLLESLDPLIASKAKQHHSGLGGRVPYSAVKNELLGHAVTAIQRYDPKRGTQLSTFVNTQFRAITDWVAANRNTQYMPKEYVRRYQMFENAKNEFRNNFGRDPSKDEIGSMLPKWSKKEVEKMMTGFRPEVFSGNAGLKHDTGMEPDHVRSAVLFMKPAMTDEQRAFADMHYPALGAQLDIRTIAQRMGVPEAKVYQIKAKVDQMLAPHLRKV
jgi:DNA-directed RNA polymerase specialized sigma subunit